jgi:hypothetical protein
MKGPFYPPHTIARNEFLVKRSFHCFLRVSAPHDLAVSSIRFSGLLDEATGAAFAKFGGILFSQKIIRRKLLNTNDINMYNKVFQIEV